MPVCVTSAWTGEAGPRYRGGMTLRPLASIFLGCAVVAAPACSASNDDSSGSTSPEPATSTGATTQAGGTTNIEDPTSAGPTAEASTAAEATTNAEATTSAETTTAESSSGGPTTADTGATGVTFTDVFEQVILVRGCNVGYCHGMGIGGLEMTDEATSYANLVDVAATVGKCGQTQRVVPGSLEESVLWYRVRPIELDMGMPCASKMPEGSMGLTVEEAQVVNEWILGGALE